MTVFVAICGMPGSGKTTTARSFQARLDAIGLPCDLVSPLQANSELVRRLSRLPAPTAQRWPERERWMTDYLTLRLIDVTELKILPPLKAGKWVVTDRWLPDQMVNQAFFGVEVSETQQPAIGRLPSPALIAVLDVPAEVALRRNEERSAGPFAVRQDFLEHARLAYRDFAAKEASALLLDGLAPVEKTVDLILDRLGVKR